MSAAFDVTKHQKRCMALKVQAFYCWRQVGDEGQGSWGRGPQDEGDEERYHHHGHQLSKADVSTSTSSPCQFAIASRQRKARMQRALQWYSVVGTGTEALAQLLSHPWQCTIAVGKGAWACTTGALKLKHTLACLLRTTSSGTC